ncbi:MAG: hypothetical protein QXY87_10750 [Saccharolobus sp.]|uniref:hypothetical protein n=1 Tax=Saccharolobus TaxID=2100760 RepID=UPI001F119386|nr:hypothetical protein [Saccharolobus shibatae]MCH4816306.1 hypothetical protein [Saccharolobus shibatae]
MNHSEGGTLTLSGRGGSQLQAMLPYNKMKFKDMSWERFSQILRMSGQKVPKIPLRGSQVKDLYVNKDYSSILKRNKANS